MDKLSPATGRTWNSDLLNSNQDPSPTLNRVLPNPPAACECARVGRRPLAIAPWVEGLSQNKRADQYNVELSHQHLVFELTKDNVGFGPKGLFSEKVETKEYRLEPECLDGATLRQAVELVPAPERYGFFRSNCQVYVEQVLTVYRRLRGE
jgi:hypothetical protein